MLVGVIIGASVVFLFSSLLIMAVGRAAQRVVFEVREQFRTHPGIMNFTEKPEYGRVVDICTKDSLRELVTPGLLAILTPIAIGFSFGYAPLGSYLAGAIAAGVLMAVFLANSGGAWDNAKKYVEDGHYGGKGSEAHAATVIGDTVGDPFKDTAGPAINPLIKVMNLVSLLIAPSVVTYARNDGLRVGVALGAVIVIVAAIVISKRRSAGVIDGGPDDGGPAAVEPEEPKWGWPGRARPRRAPSPAQARPRRAQPGSIRASGRPPAARPAPTSPSRRGAPSRPESQASRCGRCMGHSTLDGTSTGLGRPGT